MCLQRRHAIPTWTTVKVSEFEKLPLLCKCHRYLRFSDDYRDYHLEINGQSCLCYGPVDQGPTLGKAVESVVV